MDILIQIIIPCCIQAFIFERSSQPETLIVAQSLVSILDTTPNKKRDYYNIFMQSILYSASLFLPWISTILYPDISSFALAGLFRASSPILILLIKRDTTIKRWLNGILVTLGLIISVYGNNVNMNISTFILLGLSSVASVGIGIFQENYGPCRFEMSVVSFIILASLISIPKNIMDVVFLCFYTLVSRWTNKSVMKYSKNNNYNAFKLTLALSLRRVISVGLSNKITKKLFIGAIFVLIGVINNY